MDFLDRKEELGRLRRAGSGREAALVVIWGRRRVGKTRLLLEWTRGSGGLYHVADESAAPLQRRALAQTVALRLPSFADVDYPDWSVLLDRLAREAATAAWRGPMVLDELPYLVAASPELPSVLQRFVDHAAREVGLVLAIAGSSQRMMQGLVLDASAPLYGRAREILRLGPLPAGHLPRAFGFDDPARAVEAWALFGGIPRYWELAAPYGDLRTAVAELVLDPLGALHEEPVRLLLEESPPAAALRPLLDAIGAGAHRLSEIAGRIGQPATALSRPLARLQELELIRREVPWGEPERSSKRSLYKLGDPFLRAWFRLVGPRRSVLMQQPRRARLKLLDEAWPQLVAVAWEELCRAAVPHLARHLGGVDFGPAARYWAGSAPEWDVLSCSDDGHAFLVGEAKWTLDGARPADVEKVLRELAARGRPPVPAASGAELHQVLFVRARPRPAVRLPRHQHLVDAREVIAALR